MTSLLIPSLLVRACRPRPDLDRKRRPDIRRCSLLVVNLPVHLCLQAQKQGAYFMEAWQKSAPTWHGNGFTRAMATTLLALCQLPQALRHHGGAIEGVSTVVYPMSG